MGKINNNLALVFVNLLDEGTPTIRPTNAEVLGDNLYRLLPTKRYDPEDETWEFPPGSVVACEKSLTDEGAWVLFAVDKDRVATSEDETRAPVTVETAPIVVFVESWGRGKVPSLRLANAEFLGGDRYRLLPKVYDIRKHERWVFPAGAIVECERKQSDTGVWKLQAVRRIDKKRIPEILGDLFHRIPRLRWVFH